MGTRSRLPWHLESNKSGCSGWAVVKDQDGSIAGCHPTKAKAQKHMAALYANEPKMKEQHMADDRIDCEGPTEDRASVDNSAWDKGPAMSGCANSKTPGSCYDA